MERRLAAILAADVVGYSKLMGEDEAGTLAALRSFRQEILSSTVAAHRGTLIKSMGDGWLVEFASIADAIACAIRIQELLSDREVFKLRVGVHLGDVTFEDDDIYGDGVNIASRLQELAEPGAVVISDVARRTVDTKLAAAFNDLGPRELKNIKETVTAHGWGMTAATPVTAGRPAARRAEKPSIAVLPFENISSHDDQEYFADGIAEDIITALSKFRWFFVAPRNSTFAYRNQSPTAQLVSTDLGVRYVLTGSVRRAGERIRITIQLVDGISGIQVWSDRFDGEIADIFALQDAMTEAIVAVVEPEIAGAERARSIRKSTANADAWELYHQALWHFHQSTNTGLTETVAKLERAIELDPGFGRAHAALGLAYKSFVQSVGGENRDETLDRAEQAARTALVIDEQDAFAHYVMSTIHSARGEPGNAIAESKRALEINPNMAVASYALGFNLIFANRPGEAIQYLDQAMRQSPNDPEYWLFESLRGVALWAGGDADAAVEWFLRAGRHPNSGFWPHLNLACTYADLDQMDGAEAALRTATERAPKLTVSAVERMILGMSPEMLSRYLKLIRKAGLPD